MARFLLQYYREKMIPAGVVVDQNIKNAIFPRINFISETILKKRLLLKNRVARVLAEDLDNKTL